jgi:asparagine synthase (glutamine-hydrolysing)
MCGIAGIADISAIPKTDKLNSMLGLIHHRGPDHTGIFQDKNICLGHCRLSIIDLSANANQPMVCTNKAAIVHNGEVYNFLELRKELEILGHVFKSNSDTEVLLLGYLQWGEDVVNKIKGFFSFAIWDIEKQILFCARDPFGKKPFYYYWDKKRFIFSSEIEALISGIGFRPAPNYEGFSHYLLKGYFEAGLSAYKNIYSLKAGHILRLETKTSHLESKPYCVPKFNLGEIDIDYESALDEGKKFIGEAVKSRLMADVPIGILLSGGVDSSLVAMFSSLNSQKTVEALTISFKEKQFDESSYAKQIAGNLGIKHRIINTSSINLSFFLTKLAQVYGEPFGDESAIPTYQAFEAAGAYAKVILTGDGADEVFGGYVGTDLYILRARMQPFFKYLSFLSYGWPEIFLCSKYRFSRQLAHLGTAMRFDGAEAFYSLYRDSWTKNQRQSAMRKEGWERIGANFIETKIRLAYLDSGKTDMERYLNLGLERLTGGFLVKTDRSSMAHSVEARCPMLDIDLFNFISRLPEKILFFNNTKKDIPKKILAQRVGKDFAYRRKMGFTPPISCWLRDKNISEWLKVKLLNPKGIVFELFEPDKIRSMIENHRKGYNHSSRLWKLLFLEEWFDKKFGL